VLLADQALLLVVSEGGDAVLLAADPERHKSWGAFAPWTARRGTTP
jgi:hypothetical protein